MLSNSESCYNVSKTELNLLETIDVQFLRRILKAPISTPKEMLFLELGCVPFRHLIRKRRIYFLHHILNEDKDSMMFKFLQTQLKNKRPKDWITQVLKDLEDLRINLSLDDIKELKKSELKNIVNKAVMDKAYEDLTKLKESHSKVMKVKHFKLEMQKYLKSNPIKISQEEAQMIFKLRSRVTDVKINQRGKYEEYECALCKKEDESQKHIMECEELDKFKKKNTKPPEYEKLFDGSVKELQELSQHFIENMKTKEKLEKNV